jgi:hypothetical protein
LKLGCPSVNQDAKVPLKSNSNALKKLQILPSLTIVRISSKDTSFQIKSRQSRSKDIGPLLFVSQVGKGMVLEKETKLQFSSDEDCFIKICCSISRKLTFHIYATRKVNYHFFSWKESLSFI